MSNPTLFEGARMTMEEAINLTIASLCSYAERYRHWAVAYSGGKDSSATVTQIASLIAEKRIPAPKSLTVLYADTRMELPPLRIAAVGVLDELARRGIETRIVLPELDERFFVYMLGRGVPPPKNRFRWCTAQIKIEPMLAALKSLRERVGEKLLMITGVRLGESAARDARIVLSCSRDGAECGQGWFQEATPEAIADTLAPLLHWRVCHVWDWLRFFAPGAGFPTAEIAKVYGQDDHNGDIHARTGCVGCPLASRDNSLEAVIRKTEWAYLSPLLKLRPLYESLTFNHANRLRKSEIEIRKDGKMVKNPQRVGPLTMEARKEGLGRILAIQHQVNEIAALDSRPLVDILNHEEQSRIRELIAANTWPQGWDGTEALGDTLLDAINADGTMQPLIRGLIA